MTDLFSKLTRGFKKMISKRNAMGTTGLILDLDDTLFDSQKAYREALLKVRIDPKDEEFLRARSKVKERLGDGNPTARNRLLYFKEMLTCQGKYTPKALLQLVNEYDDHLSRSIQKQWEELGRKVLFERISRQFPIVILTNENTRTQTIKINAIDSDGCFFKIMLTSEELGVEKPHLSAFISAKNAFDVPCNKYIVVGDSLKNDIQPAINLGWKGILTTEFTEPKFLPPASQDFRVISNLNLLPEILGIL